ncbi:unnamed protein product [Fraxinus pennsylvanica]|uniref:SAM domain-containing protein n=1 Tax=Fraxinus pennsylvanica TaxID=56036 RepID=A0AAD1ZT78_9LAMI|nr:unnamed protein product [Fraxinus pennsylvanica]
MSQYRFQHCNLHPNSDVSDTSDDEVVVQQLEEDIEMWLGYCRIFETVVNDHLTVESFLQSLGLEKYAIYFKAEEVDMYSLKQMGGSDLKALGIPMVIGFVN